MESIRVRSHPRTSLRQTIQKKNAVDSLTDGSFFVNCGKLNTDRVWCDAARSMLRQSPEKKE